MQKTSQKGLTVPATLVVLLVIFVIGLFSYNLITDRGEVATIPEEISNPEVNTMPEDSEVIQDDQMQKVTSEMEVLAMQQQYLFQLNLCFWIHQ